MKCSLCGCDAPQHRVVDGVSYFDCAECDFIFAHPDFLELVDAGRAPRQYDENYWKAEVRASWERSFGGSLARFAEAVLYCQIPIRKSIDIGTGPGFLLEALQYQLPSSAHKFYGVEKFPGTETAVQRLSHPRNYIVGSLGDVTEKFEVGTCIEVLEHLTPLMAQKLAEQLAAVSVPGSLFLFNTGLTDFVRSTTPGYLDPLRRGHICSWSVTSAKKVLGPHGFNVYPLEGKPWAFVAEFERSGPLFSDRIWKALPENVELLKDPVAGHAMYILGIESARVYPLESRLERARKH